MINKLSFGWGSVKAGVLILGLVIGWFIVNETTTIRSKGPLEIAKDTAAQFSNNGRFELLGKFEDDGCDCYILKNVTNQEIVYVKLRPFFGGYQMAHYRSVGILERQS